MFSTSRTRGRGTRKSVHPRAYPWLPTSTRPLEKARSARTQRTCSARRPWQQHGGGCSRSAPASVALLRRPSRCTRWRSRRRQMRQLGCRALCRTLKRRGSSSAPSAARDITSLRWCAEASLLRVAENTRRCSALQKHGAIPSLPHCVRQMRALLSGPSKANHLLWASATDSRSDGRCSADLTQRAQLFCVLRTWAASGPCPPALAPVLHLT